MDFDYQWLLIGLPAAFALGWLASRFDIRQFRRSQRDAPRAYFHGLNLLLNEQQDKAIDAFIEAVQNDPDTTELHFALGNLFRRRGEFERSVRVHQHLLQRADLSRIDRDRAQLALAQDFMKAGLFDRAEEAWRALHGTAFDSQAQLALLSIFERSHDWAKAAEVAVELERAAPGSFATRVAHHHCELALEADARGDTQAGDQALQKARAAAPEAPRAQLLAGQRLVRAGEPAQALLIWDALRAQHVAAFMLVASDYARCALATEQADSARQALLEQHARYPAMDLLRALALLPLAGAEGETHAAKRWVTHVREHGSLAAAAEVLALAPTAWPADAQAAAHSAVANAARPLQRYRCAACGFEAQHYFWQCPGCLSWDSYPAQKLEEL